MGERYIVVGDRPDVAVQGETFTDKTDAQGFADRLTADTGRRHAVRVLGHVAGKAASGTTSRSAT